MTRSLLAIGLAMAIGATATATAWSREAAPVAVPYHVAPGVETAAQPVPAFVQVRDREMMVTAYGLTVGQLEGAALFGHDGREIGRIGGVLVTPQGEESALSVEVGNFLGAGHKEVILPLASVGLQGNHLVAAMTRHEIEALPAWSR